MNRIIALTALMAALAPTQAMAWKHIDPSPYGWLPEDMPIPYWVQPECEESVPSTYCLEMLQASYASWKDVPCVSYDFEYRGDYENATTFDLNDPKNHFSFNDPDGTLEAGVLGATLVSRFGFGFNLFGQEYAHARHGDISFNDNVDFTSQDAVEAGTCNGESNIRAVAVHEIGHFMGLGHSCDEGEACNDPELLEAIMYWTSPACENNVFPQPDDIEGITPLYGPGAQFSCSHQVSPDLAIGVVPFDLNCVVESADNLQDVTNAEWTFGDGNVGEGMVVTNTYNEPGNYTIQVGVRGENEQCGEEGWNSTFRKVGFVRACGIADAEFSVVHDDGLVYQLLNQTDVSVYGCIQDIAWEVYKGDKVSGDPIDNLSAKAWEPLIEFPEPGTYTVVLNVGGAAGTGAAKLTFEVVNRSTTGCACSSGTGGTGSAILALALGLLAIRRRR